MTTLSKSSTFWSNPISTSIEILFREFPTPDKTVLQWFPGKIETTISVGNTISIDAENKEMLAYEITPGWWSEELTEEDIEISLMSREAVLSEILEMSGSWADREDTIAAIDSARKVWGKKISELHADKDNPA
jgi:hypothetical protein